MALRINKNKNHDFPKSKDKWASWVTQLHDDAVRERRPMEFQWAVNTAYYLGFQHLNFSPFTGMLHRDWQNDELIINRIAPFVEQRVAKLTRSKPILTVLPDRTDPKTLNAARLNEMLIKYLWKQQSMDEKAQTHATNITLMGSSFIKTIWNPDVGDEIEVEDGEEGFVNLTQEGARQTKKILMGDIETHIKTPFSIMASPGATSMDDAIWLIDRSHMTVRQLKEAFPNIDIDQITVAAELTEFEKFVNRLQSPIFSSIAGVDQSRLEKKGTVSENELVLVKEFWLKPNEVYPRGVVATVIGSRLIDFKEFPNDILDFPYIKSDDRENVFGFYGQATLTRLIPVQRRYNQGRTQIATNAALMANVKWWAPKGHGMSEDSLTDEEGEVVESNPNLPRPQQLPVAPLPNYIVDALVQDISDIRDIGGEREPSQLPFPNLTAGVALETAAELADTIIQPIIRGLERSFIRIGKQWLLLAQKHFIDPRIIKVVGEGNQVHVKEIKNTDLLHQTDVSIQLESFLGSSKAAQQQKLLDMWDRRIISDPAMFMKAFVTGDIDIVLKEKEAVENVIAEDIERIKNGEQPPVMPFDDHVTYVKKLSDFIQTPEFRRMPPDRQQIAMVTLQQHLQFIQPQQEEQQNPAAVNTPFGQQVTEGG